MTRTALDLGRGRLGPPLDLFLDGFGLDFAGVDGRLWGWLEFCVRGRGFFPEDLVGGLPPSLFRSFMYGFGFL